MDLFEQVKDQTLGRSAPLAARMRPRILSEYVGQEHILGQGRLLRRAIETDTISSVLFYGPPGTGKTTLARIIANTTRSDFISMNAVLSGVKEIKDAVLRAQDSLKFNARKSILFIDEVHRFNKSQQDALLPHVENGTVVLIGATTENPYFEVNKALVSRSRIFQLRPLTDEHLRKIIQMALADKERGFGNMSINLHHEAIEHFIKVCNGDARSLLNAFELAVNSTPGDHNGVIQITLEVAAESIQQKAVLYDKDGDAHYDTISAFIKSLRGSDPDAALYWMSRMIYAGEDPRYIFRRMLILASEDVGLADPQAITIVMSAAQAYDYVGMPEGQFHLSQAAIYLATCPKSNSTLSYFDALNAVQEEQLGDIPNHLKDGSRDKEGFGHGVNYKYPHAYRDHWVEQQYLPDVLQGKKFYQPGLLGYEGKVQEQINRRRELQLAAFFEGSSLPEALFEINDSAQKQNSQKENWQQRANGEMAAFFDYAQKLAIEALDIKPDSLTLDLQFGSGLFTFELCRRVKSESVYTIIHQESEKKLFDKLISEKSNIDHLQYLDRKGTTLLKVFENHQIQNMNIDRVIGFRVLQRWRYSEFFEELRAKIQSGKLVLFELVPKYGQRPLAYLKNMNVASSDLDFWQQAEDSLFNDTSDQMLNWDHQDIEAELLKFPGVSVQHKIVPFKENIVINKLILQRLFLQQNNNKICYGDRMKKLLGDKEYEKLRKAFEEKLLGVKTTWLSTFVLIVADFVKAD